MPIICMYETFISYKQVTEYDLEMIAEVEQRLIHIHKKDSSWKVIGKNSHKQPLLLKHKQEDAVIVHLNLLENELLFQPLSIQVLITEYKSQNNINKLHNTFEEEASSEQTNVIHEEVVNNNSNALSKIYHIPQYNHATGDLFDYKDSNIEHFNIT
ncbi:MAG: hypothetical protein AB8U25_02945 [Rickettsiales endosymbiont of Dermacentor nuttalli]